MTNKQPNRLWLWLQLKLYHLMQLASRINGTCNGNDCYGFTKDEPLFIFDGKKQAASLAVNWVPPNNADGGGFEIYLYYCPLCGRKLHPDKKKK